MVDKSKAVGQFRLQCLGLLYPFASYGMKDFIPGTVDQMVKLALQLHERLNGDDVAIKAGAVTSNPTSEAIE